MARIAGVDLPRDQRVVVGLTAIYGIGPTSSKRILDQTQVSSETRVKDLTEDEIARIRDVVDHNYVTEGDLRREVNLNVKRLIEIGSYRGLRHRRGLPVHGQRTKTNARQRRGAKRTVGARRSRK